MEFLIWCHRFGNKDDGSGWHRLRGVLWMDCWKNKWMNEEYSSLLIYFPLKIPLWEFLDYWSFWMSCYEILHSVATLLQSDHMASRAVGTEIHVNAVVSQVWAQWKVIAWGLHNLIATGREWPFTNTKDLLTFGWEKSAFVFQESKSSLVNCGAFKGSLGWWTSARTSCSNM